MTAKANTLVVVCDDRENARTALVGLMTAHHVPCEAVEDGDKLREIVANRADRQLYLIIDKSLGEGRQAGLDLVEELSTLAQVAECYLVTAFGLSGSEDKRVKSLAEGGKVFFADKAAFAAERLALALGESEQPPETCIIEEGAADMESSDLQSRLFEERTQRVAFQYMVANQEDSWRRVVRELSRPLLLGIPSEAIEGATDVVLRVDDRDLTVADLLKELDVMSETGKLIVQELAGFAANVWEAMGKTGDAR